MDNDDSSTSNMLVDYTAPLPTTFAAVSTPHIIGLNRLETRGTQAAEIIPHDTLPHTTAPIKQEKPRSVVNIIPTVPRLGAVTVLPNADCVKLEDTTTAYHYTHTDPDGTFCLRCGMIGIDTSDCPSHIKADKTTPKLVPKSTKFTLSPFMEDPATVVLEDRFISYLPVHNRDLCWRCGNPGHTRYQCEQPHRLFCSRCGRIGIMSSQCLCKFRRAPSPPPMTALALQPVPEKRRKPNTVRSLVSTSVQCNMIRVALDGRPIWNTTQDNE